MGLAEEAGYGLPLTQSELADALGLSTVHINRGLQSLRKDGLIVWHGRFITVPDWPALRQAGEFDRDSLHMHPTEAATA